MNKDEIISKIEEIKGKKSLTAGDKIELKKLEKELNKINSPVESSGVFVTEDDSYDTSRVSYVDVDKIIANPNQPRKIFDENILLELSESIKTHGLLQPIVVADTNGKYMLIAGERRYRAHKLANIGKIKAIIVANKSDLEIKELSIIENTQRKDLNCMEEAIAYKELQTAFGYSIRQLEDRLSKPKTHIHTRLQLTNFDDDCIDFILKQNINNTSKLLKILGLENTLHKMLLEKLSKNELSNNEIENFKVGSIEKLPDEKQTIKTQKAVETNHDKFDENPSFDKDNKIAAVEALSEKIKEEQEAEEVNKSVVLKQSDSFLVKSLGDVVNITIDKSKLTGKDLEAILDIVKSL